MQSARGRLVPYDAYLKGGPKIAGSSSPGGCQWLFSLLLIVISILGPTRESPDMVIGSHQRRQKARSNTFHLASRRRLSALLN